MSLNQLISNRRKRFLTCRFESLTLDSGATFVDLNISNDLTVQNDANILGIGTIDSLNVTNALDVGTDLDVSGSTTLEDHVILRRGVETLQIASHAASTSYGLTLPAAQGGASEILQNDGAGNLSWVPTPSMSVSEPFFTNSGVNRAIISGDSNTFTSFDSNGCALIGGSNLVTTTDAGSFGAVVVGGNGKSVGIGAGGAALGCVAIASDVTIENGDHISIGGENNVLVASGGVQTISIGSFTAGIDYQPIVDSLLLNNNPRYHLGSFTIGSSPLTNLSLQGGYLTLTTDLGNYQLPTASDLNAVGCNSSYPINHKVSFECFIHNNAPNPQNITTNTGMTIVGGPAIPAGSVQKVAVVQTAPTSAFFIFL